MTWKKVIHCKIKQPTYVCWFYSLNVYYFQYTGDVNVTKEMNIYKNGVGKVFGIIHGCPATTSYV